MSTIILLEWSLSMFEPVLNWDQSNGIQLERITQTSASRTLSAGVAGLSLAGTSSRSITLPTRLDIAATAIKFIASKALKATSICNGSIQSETIVFATFDATSLSNVSSNYDEFSEKLVTSLNANPPSKISYFNMLQSLETSFPTVKSSVVIIFCSSTKNLTATHELATAPPQVLANLLPLPFDSFLYFVSVSRRTNEINDANEFYESLVRLNNSNGQVCECSLSSLEDLTSSLYQPFFASLILGEMCGKVQLLPSPRTLRGGNNKISPEFHFLGIMDRTIIDKFFPTRPYFVLAAANQGTSDNPAMEPHLAPLLHASLKLLPGKVLLISVAPNWYAYVEALEDAKTKKRSSLVLHLFPQGSSLAPGRPPVLQTEMGESVEEDPPSYSNPGFTPVWTSVEAVHSDIGRIIRMTRRLPDKSDAFYNELNKFRLHALSSCNMQSLKTLADMLTKECQHATLAAAEELSHVILQIRPESREPQKLCDPLVSLAGKNYPLITET